MAAEALILEDAYQRGYTDAVEDMRKKKRQRQQWEQEKKARRWYFIKQKACGLAMLAITVLAVWATAQVIDMGGGRYRYLTERECWRLQGYTDADYEAAAAVHKRVGRYTMPLYKQAGNSIPVPIFESMFRKILLGETAESEV